MVIDDTEKAVFALVEEYNGHWFGCASVSP